MSAILIVSERAPPMPPMLDRLHKNLLAKRLRTRDEERMFQELELITRELPTQPLQKAFNESVRSFGPAPNVCGECGRPF
jgi:hypothetical protein